METNRQQENGNIHGNLLQLPDGRSVAIYLRAGVVSVAELNGLRGRLLGLPEWHAFHARRVALVQRRGRVEIVSPIPADVIEQIEALHRRAGEWNDHPFRRKVSALTVGMEAALAGLRLAWPDPAAIGKHLIGAGAFRVD